MLQLHTKLGEGLKARINQTVGIKLSAATRTKCTKLNEEACAYQT